VPRSVVIQSRSAAAALRAAAQWIEPLLGSSEILIAGATRAAADEFVRSLPVAGTLGIHRFTFHHLAASLAHSQMSEYGLAPATPLAMEAVCARALFQARRDGVLQYFAPVAKAPGFPAALARTVRDLRLAGVRPADLGNRPAAADIGRLLQLCEDELEARKLADLPAILQMAARSEKHPYLGLPLVLLDVPFPSQSHLTLLRRLAAKSPATCLVSVSSDERVLDFPVEAADPEDEFAIQRVRRHLFATEPPRASQYDETVELFSAPGESLESVEIARRIRAYAERGIPFDRIAILLRQPERYQPLVEEALRRADIPAYFSRGTVRPDPAGRAFLALLSCALEGCSASRFAEYMSLGQIPALDAQGAPPPRMPAAVLPDDELFVGGGGTAMVREAKPVADAVTIATPLAWEKLLVDAAVIGGYERWARRLRGLENEFKIQRGALRADEHAELERIDRELERLANLERFALPLIEDLHALPERASWGEWLEVLRRLAARALNDAEAVDSVLAELTPMAEVGPVDLEEVRAVLAERLRVIRREPPHRRYGAVFVGAIEEARGRVFDAVFVPGLAEGLFPRKAAEDPLLLDDLRREISTALETRSVRVGNERMLLRTAVSAGSRLIASYPSMDLGQGRPRVPSFYALEIVRAVEGCVPALRPFELKLSGNSEARLVWPAPRDAQRAIDDAEYDLAWLAEHHNESGAARYLMDANPHLGRSLRVRWKRWEKKWTKADGFVDPDEATRALLEQRRPSVREYSPSALQNYALCPYRFVLSGVLHLRERREAAAIEQLDPLTRGAIVHEVQRDFMRWWKSERATDRGVLLAHLDEALSTVADNYAERIAPAIPRVWHSEVEDIRTDLRGWVMEWFQQSAEWEPLHFELAFGLERDEEHDTASREDPVHVGGARVRGSIDLVERHRETGLLRITDHKTGRPLDQSPTSVAGGRVLQPVLYSLAAEVMLGAAAGEARLWYCTQRGNYTEYVIPIDPTSRARFTRAMSLIDDAISGGFLPAAPAQGSCDFCDYRSVCGPNEEVRVRRWKSADDLDPLNELRSLP
jgi:ATP-dependent helicase/nuclease subunit B